MLGISLFLMITLIAATLFTAGYKNQRDDEDRDPWDYP